MQKVKFNNQAKLQIIDVNVCLVAAYFASL
jgi:hypothetical protein